MRILTLNVGAAKAVLAEYQIGGKGSLALTAYGMGDLPAVDVESAGSMQASLTPVLRELMRANGIKSAPLVMSLSGRMVFQRFAKFPNVSAEKLEELVHYEVEQNVPFPVDEVVCDHQFLGETPEGDQAAMIVAAKLDQVREVTDAVRAAGLSPKVVDVSPMAVYNALKASQPGLTGCTIVLDMGSKTTNLVIIENEKIYNRSISVAGNTVTKEIAQTFGCTFEEAEQLKVERGYVSLGGVMEDEDEVSDRVSKVARSVLTRLHAEISRSINVFRSQQGGSAPARLFLTGGGSRLPQTDEFFRETLQVEVSYLNPFAVAKVGPKLKSKPLEDDAFSLVESVGLALRFAGRAAMQLNLLPPELVDAAKMRARIPFLVAGAVAFLGALGAGVFIEGHGKDVAEAKLECVKARNDALRSLDTRLKAEQKAFAAEAEKCDAFQKLLLSRVESLVRLDTVRRSRVPGMWIVSWEPPKDGDSPTKVTIRGWRDQMSAEERKYAEVNAGKKATAAEIVQTALKSRSAAVVVPDSVKIVSQRDVKESIVEFAIELVFAEPPSAVADVGDGKKSKAVGRGRRSAHRRCSGQEGSVSRRFRAE